MPSGVLLEHTARLTSLRQKVQLSKVLLTCIGFTGAAFGAFYGIAQGYRTFKTRSTAGVSILSWLMSASASSLWLTYGILQGSAPQVLANTPWFVSCVIIGIFMALERAVPPAIGCTLPFAMLGPGLWLLTVERNALAVIGPAFSVGMTLPQIVAARRAKSVEGVSAPAWISSVLSGILWIVYGVGTSDLPVALSSATATTLNILVLLFLVQAKRRTVVLVDR